MARSTAWPETSNTMGAPRTVRRSKLSLAATAATVAAAHRQAISRSRLLGAPMQSPHVVDDDPAVVVDAGDALDVIELEQLGARERLSLLRLPRLEIEAEHRRRRGHAQVHQQEIDVASCQRPKVVGPPFLRLAHARGIDAFDDLDP